mgnify:CR=1 FL=1
MKSFRQRVIYAVRRIPAGRVATYGDIAALAGSPRAWRAVGTIMRECRDPASIDDVTVLLLRRDR